MPLTAYQSAFELLAARLKPESVPTRRAFLDQFLVKGFPGRKQEDWRYTDLTPLNDKAFALAPAGALDLQSLKLPKTDRVVFINGQLDREQSTADELAGLVADEPVADDAVAALNAAFALPGLDFKLGRNASIARVLHVIIASEPGSPASMSHQRHRIELDELASAHVVLEFRGGGEHFQTHTIDVHLGPGARLKLDRIQRDAAASTLLTRIDAHLMLVLEPRLMILDETDSGLDIDALRIVSDGINAMRSPERAALLVTHYQRLLDYVKPDYVHVLARGNIVMSGGPELALELEQKGYGWLEAA